MTITRKVRSPAPINKTTLRLATRAKTTARQPTHVIWPAGILAGVFSRVIPKSDYRTPREIMDMKPPSSKHFSGTCLVFRLHSTVNCALIADARDAKVNHSTSCSHPFNVKDELLYPGEWPYDLVLSMPALITNSVNYQFKIGTTVLAIISL